MTTMLRRLRSGRPAREALERATPHEHGVALGTGYEVAHVLAVVHDHAAGKADAPVVADGNDGV